MLENKFYYKDEFGQEIETRRTYTEDVIDVTPAVQLMVADFVSHLRSCGYSETLIKDTIKEHFYLVDAGDDE